MIWYANIDVSVNGDYLTSGDGSESYPLTWDGLQCLLDKTRGIIGPEGQLSGLSDYDTIKIQGYYFEPSDITFVPQNINQFSATGITFEAWDQETYGFWKLGSAYGQVNLFPNHSDWGRSVSANFRDFVFEDVQIGTNEGLYNNANLNLNFYNGIFTGDSTFRILNILNPFYFEGCSFANGTFFAIDGWYGSALSAVSLSAIFDDSTFFNYNFELTPDTPAAFTFSGDYIFNNCKFNETSATIFHNTSDFLIFNGNCDFNWSPSRYFPSIYEIRSDNKDNLNFLDYNLHYDIVNGERKKWITNNYMYGAYGRSRKGPGAFYFKDDIYVDFNTSAVGTGESSTPMTSAQFLNYINSNDTTMSAHPQTSGIFFEDMFYIKGILQINVFNITPMIGSDYNLGDPYFYFKPWNRELNGPFRINAISIINIGADYSCIKPDKFFIEDAIIYSPLIYINESLSSDTVFYKTSAINIDGYTNVKFNGSTIITSSDIDITNVTLTIKDSLLIGKKLNSASINSHPTIINTVLSASSDSGLNGTNVTTITSGNQYGWSPPIWPNIDSPLSDFNYSTLGAGITILGSGDWNV